MQKQLITLCLSCCSLWAAVKPPHFFARRDYPSAVGQIAVGDINGDGIPDIVTEGDGFIHTLLGNGNGTFRVGPNTAPGGQAVFFALRVVDLNGDGKADLLLGSLSGLQVCFGNGDGTFQPGITYSGGSVGNWLVVEDFNNDGILDVIITGTAGVELYLGLGGGVFNSGVLLPVSPTATNGAYISAADFNKDGNMDLVVSYRPQGFAVLLGNGDGTFQSPVIYPAPWAGNAAGDVNGDGYPDIVVAGGDVYLNNGHGAFGAAAQISLPGTYVAIGDLNGDGIPDLVTNVGQVAYGKGHGKFTVPIYHPEEGSDSVFNVVIADLRNDGLNDFIVGHNGAASVILNAGKDAFVDGDWITVSGGSNCAAAGDFNGDGKPDLAVPTSSGIELLMGTGKGAAPYTPGTTISLSGPGCPIAGDVNGDGIPDIIEGANSLGGVGVFLSNGDGTFQPPIVIPFAVAQLMVTGDFNHDGKLDIATSGNQFALGNGDGTFQAPTTILAGLPPCTWIAAGDVNNDGWTDIVYTAIEFGAGVYVLLNDQQGSFTESTVPQATHIAGGVTLGDLNGDGNLDMVITSPITYIAAVALGDGKGNFTIDQYNLNFPFVDPVTAQIGDVNGDGFPDILMPADGSLGVALGIGNGKFQQPFVVGVGPAEGQILLQNLHGQSPNAGLPDIVAPDASGGVLVLLNLTK